MIEDPIVEELHEIRRAMLEEYGGLEGLVRHLRDVESTMPEPVVDLPRKQPIQPKRKIS
jgi:hypothetical protein